MDITFDKAIEILEITDISKVTIESLPKIKRKASKRWHPDKVESKKNPKLTEEYNRKFQQIEPAIEIIRSYLEGTYHAGDAYSNKEKYHTTEPEEIIRENAPNMQSTLFEIWNLVKEKRYKWVQKTVNLSDGFKLKDLLKEDFEYDISYDTIFSFFYGSLYTFIASIVLTLLSLIWEGLNTVNMVIGIVWFIFTLMCFIMILPLSRFWLPKSIKDFISKIIYSIGFDDGWTISIIPFFIGVIFKYLIIFPLYEIAKLFIGDKVVGIVNENVNYYANLAEWYIDELISKSPNSMSKEELFHLSHLYNELSDVKSKT